MGNVSFLSKSDLVSEGLSSSLQDVHDKGFKTPVLETIICQGPGFHIYLHVPEALQECRFCSSVKLPGAATKLPLSQIPRIPQEGKLLNSEGSSFYSLFESGLSFYLTE